MQAPRNLLWKAPLRARFLGSTALLPAMWLLACTGIANAQMPLPGAAPVGGSVVAGAAVIAQSPGRTQIMQSTDRAAINWQQFNVGRDHQVNFQQPSSSSWTLNRVTGPDPSVIAGRVTANGGVALVNQSGMVFARGAEVNVASLIASAPNITNDNFMAGRMVFDGRSNAGARIENSGKITVAQRGLAALVGPEVANKGVIQARMGKVALAGAETYTLDLAGDGMLSIDVTQSVQHAPDGGAALVTNSGTIRAEGGSVLLTANAASGLMETLIANTGRIMAPTIPASAGSPERTGAVALRAQGGGVRVDGTLKAAGGAAANGGSIEVNADAAVTLSGRARLNASGGTGGGRVYVGTSGVGGDHRMASSTTIAAGARIRTGATRKGNGGTVAINSRDSTNFAGLISARGGPEGGDGGLVEMSGRGALTLAGSVDVRAYGAGGLNGTLLLDPLDILITGPLGTGASNPVQAGNGTVLAASAPTSGTLTIGNDQIEGFAGNVRLEATRNITVSHTIGKSNGGLTLLAQTGLADIQQQIASTGTLSVTGANVKVGSGAALGSLGNVNVTSTVGDLTIDPNATLAAATSVNLTSQRDVINNGTISGGGALIVAGRSGAAGTTSNAVNIIAGRDFSNGGAIAGIGGGAPITTGGTLAAVFIEATGGTIINTGTISAIMRSDGTGGLLELNTAGVATNRNNNAPVNGGPIVNASGASLRADNELLVISNTSFQNDGVITGGLAGGGPTRNAINIQAATALTNNGTITGTGGGAPFPTGGVYADVFVQSLGTLVNTGTITALVRPDGTGGNLHLDTTGANTSLTNKMTMSGGSITNDAGGILLADRLVNLTSNTSITNSGTATGGLVSGGQDTRAVSLSAATTITNTATGTITGNGGGQLTNNGANSISAVTLTTADGAITNAGTIQSIPVGANYGSIVITAGGNGGNLINSAVVNSARNTIINANGYIRSSGTIIARTGRIDLIASGGTLLDGAAVLLDGGVVETLGEPPPNQAPLNRGRVTLSASRGDISITGEATMTGQADVLISAANGGVRFDGAAVSSGGTVRVDATAELVNGGEAGSIRFDNATVNATELVGRVAPGGTGIDLDSATFNLGRAMLLVSPGGITNNDGSPSTVAPLVAGQLPVVIFDIRANGSALSDIPGGVAPDVPGQAAAIQPAQLRLFGGVSANAAGTVALQLDAGLSPLFLLLDGGSTSGSLTAGRLAVLGLGGSTDLSGSLGGQTGNAAAALASVSTQASAAAAQRYQFNSCVFGSANCTFQFGGQALQAFLAVVPINLANGLGNVAAAVNATSSLRSLMVPQPEIVRFRPLRGRLADPDVLLPNVVEQDY